MPGPVLRRIAVAFCALGLLGVLLPCDLLWLMTALLVSFTLVYKAGRE